MINNRNPRNTAWIRWLVLGAILVSQLVVLLASPEEKTLGSGIKPVYLHVSLTWTGLFLLIFSILLSVWLVITAGSKISRWQAYVINSGFVIFGIGFVVSMYASQINWGGVPFGEPAVRQAVGYILVGVLLWISMWWIKAPRLGGLIGLIAAGMLLLATESSQSILHPESPVNNSPDSIRMTFYLMFGLGLILAIWSLDFQKIFIRRNSWFVIRDDL